MEVVLNQLSRSVVISAEDILNIKKRIGQQYAPLSYAEKAGLLAEVLHAIVDRALEGIETHLWPEIKRSLFKNTLASNKEGINKKDIFDEVLTLNEELGTLCVTAYNWLVQQSVEGLNPGELGRYVRHHAANIKPEPVELVENDLDIEDHRADHQEDCSAMNLQMKEVRVNRKYRLTRLGWGVVLGLPSLMIAVLIKLL